MRRFMTREVTSTLIKVAKMETNEEGLPVANPVGEKTLLGNIKMDRAQKIAREEFGEGATVFHLEANTHKYRMPVETFVELADIVTDENEEEDEDEFEDEEEQA